MSSSFSACINERISEVLLERTSFIQEMLDRKVLLLVPFLDFFFFVSVGILKRHSPCWVKRLMTTKPTDVQLSGGLRPDYIGRKPQACALCLDNIYCCIFIINSRHA